MKLLIISNYYNPEIGAAPSRISMLAEGLSELGNDVDIVCPLPNYPFGKIFDGYKNKLSIKEVFGSVQINRYWIYPSVSGNVIERILSMFSFSVSQLLFLFEYKKIKNVDWIIIQNSPLLVSFFAIGLFGKINKKIALNISDLWPMSALELGAIKKGKFYSLLEWIEKYNYKKSKLIIGQSEEILKHVNGFVDKPVFLYRNLQKNNNNFVKNKASGTFKIIYAGLLGLAQGVFEIIQNIDFKELGVEFHVYGQGNESEIINEYIAQNPLCNIFYLGAISKNDIQEILPSFHASIVPLKTSIKGAVPSKIFELAQYNVPILFCGGGEGADIVNSLGLGYVSEPANYGMLKKNIAKIKNLSTEKYNELLKNCESAVKNNFDFNEQLKQLQLVLSKK